MDTVTFSHRFVPLIQIEQFEQLFPNNKEPEIWTSVLNDVLPQYNITTKERVAMFLAQCGHESNGFTVLKENLNYSAQGLANTWARFSSTGKRGGPPNELALRLHRKPEQIANVVYANRMGNGDESSGDGWKHIGRGAIQTTGKNNYRIVSQELFGDDRLLDNPDILLYPEFAIKAACVFWKNNGLNDVTDIKKSTKIINGGLNGLDDRAAKLNKAMKIL